MADYTEEFKRKAEELARNKARNYKTVYSEDSKLKEVMKDPLRFDQDYLKRLYLLMKEKHYRDGYADGYITGVTTICKKILEEIYSHKWDYEDAWDRNFEVILASDIRDFIKNLGVDTDD